MDRLDGGSELGQAINTVLTVLVLIIGLYIFLPILVSKDGRGRHDCAVGTNVVFVRGTERTETRRDTYRRSMSEGSGQVWTAPTSRPLPMPRCCMTLGLISDMHGGSRSLVSIPSPASAGQTRG